MAIKDPESLTDRVLALEKRLEDGNFAFRPSQAAGAGEAPVIRDDIRMPEAPKALPEDVRKLVESWPKIISECPNDMSYMKTCKPVLGDDGKLVLYFSAGNMGAKLLNNEQPHNDLSEIFENHVGASVEFSVKETDSDEMFDSGLYDLRNMVKPGTVNVPIDTEEDTEEF